MAKDYTKAQAKRIMNQIDGKAARLFTQGRYISMADYQAIERILVKAFKKLK